MNKNREDQALSELVGRHWKPGAVDGEAFQSELRARLRKRTRRKWAAAAMLIAAVATAGLWEKPQEAAPLAEAPATPALEDTAIAATSAAEEGTLSWSLQGDVELEALDLPGDYQALNTLLFDL